MAEKTFRSPGFFEREIDLADRVASPSGVPAGLIGTANQGPAFVPVTVGTFEDFVTRFGNLDPNRFGPYAVREFLRNRNSLTYVRTLGAGANSTLSDIDTTIAQGTVKNAGFFVSGTVTDDDGNTAHNATMGSVQFIVANHDIVAAASASMPDYDNNDSRSETGVPDALMNLVRGVIFFATGTRGMVTGSEVDIPSVIPSSLATFGNVAAYNDSTFKLIISSTAGAAFASDDNLPGLKILTASLNPRSDSYFAKLLNTDPLRFQEEQHLLYADFLVDNEVGPVKQGTLGDEGPVAIVSGSGLTSSTSGNTALDFLEIFGRYDTRYTTPTSPWIISQPYGTQEYDLLRFETLSDGAWGNDKYKVSIANVRASTNPNDEYGTFEVQVRRIDDTDITPEIVESFPDCSLNPRAERYVARLIGDRKVRFDFDAEVDEEKRLVVTGKYPNRSLYIRVVMNRAVENQDVPASAVPFGFRGVPVIRTSNSLTDLDDVALTTADGTALGQTGTPRLAANSVTELTGSIVPPLLFRTKVTRGTVDTTTAGFLGDPGPLERVDNRLYWGTVTTRLSEGQLDNPNIGIAFNPLVRAYTKFMGIDKLDATVTGSAADDFNNNKFTLSRVALNATSFANLTGSARETMLEAAYIRNGVVSGTNYTVADPFGPLTDRLTMATLVNSSSTVFNRFTAYNKFTTVFYGGFDGLNILDRDNFYMTDRGSSGDTGGKAGANAEDLGLYSDTGAGEDNNLVASYRIATRIMTDPFSVRTNILAIPGIKDSFVTDFASQRVRDYALAIYLMDIPSYGINSAGSYVRLFGDKLDASGLRPSAQATAESLEERTIDNNYVATYFPDVVINDEINGNRKVKVPASVAAVAALGFNDNVSFPWFAPAGFNRGALDFVDRTEARLLTADRDDLYDARINPIASIPVNSSADRQFVIFGQKTLQLTQSALDRVNVRRMVLEVKRIVGDVARRLLFEPNTPTTRQRFVAQASPQLALIQAQQGIETFQIVMDSSNNTEIDVQQNRLNGRIVMVPTRAIEFIAVDFIIDSTGVSFA